MLARDFGATRLKLAELGITRRRELGPLVGRVFTYCGAQLGLGARLLLGALLHFDVGEPGRLLGHCRLELARAFGQKRQQRIAPRGVIAVHPIVHLRRRRVAPPFERCQPDVESVALGEQLAEALRCFELLGHRALRGPLPGGQPG